MLKKIFYLDLRSLALFRILVGLVLLTDLLLIRGPHLFSFFSDWGVFPRSFVLQNFNNFNFSLYFVNGSKPFVLAVYAIQVFCAFCFTIGYRTRFFTFASWILLVSLHNRNILINSGDDDLLRWMLLWSLFLPLNGRASVDHAASTENQAPNRDEAPSNRVTNLASFALIFQILAVYIATGLLKLHPRWTSEATALYYALSLDSFTTSFAHWVRGWDPDVLKLLTKTTLYFEIWAPLLVLVPFRNALFRSLCILAFWGFHLTLAMLFYLGLFPWLAIVCWAALIPSAWWDVLLQRSRRHLARKVLYYDPQCGFCRRSVYLLKSFLGLDSLKIEPCPARGPVYDAMTEKRSWILKRKGSELLAGYDVFVELLRGSPFFGVFAPLFATRVLVACGSRAYRSISSRRALASFFIPRRFGYSSIETRLSRPRTGLLIFLLVYALAWNVMEVSEGRLLNITGNFRALGHFFRLEQSWNMFAPYPSTDDGWVVVEGKLKDATTVNVLDAAAELSWERPTSVALSYDGPKWRKFWLSLWNYRNSSRRAPVGKYLCRRWNDMQNSSGRELLSYQVHFMSEATPAPGVASQVEKLRMWSHDCEAVTANASP